MTEWFADLLLSCILQYPSKTAITLHPRSVVGREDSIVSYIVLWMLFCGVCQKSIKNVIRFSSHREDIIWPHDICKLSILLQIQTPTLHGNQSFREGHIENLPPANGERYLMASRATLLWTYAFVLFMQNYLKISVAFVAFKNWINLLWTSSQKKSVTRTSYDTQRCNHQKKM